MIQFPPLLSDLGSNGAGELDHGDPLGLRRRSGSAAPQGRHRAPAANRNPQAGAEDRHGREDEEDGRHAAVHGHRRQEEEDNPGAGMKPPYWLQHGEQFHSAANVCDPNMNQLRSTSQS